MLRAVDQTARLMAIIGGLVLTVLVVLICISVLGRGLNTLGHAAFLNGLSPDLASALIAGVGPVQGDFELVEAGIAFAIFAFLPICQLYGGHATVDVFMSFLPGRANQWLMAFWEAALATIIILISWRLCLGMLDKLRYGETTLLLQFPIWWAYGASSAASLVAALVSIYGAAARIKGLVTGRDYLPTAGGAPS
jgi:TRAP-type C4-dicarboxylate transport system permease small subunit